MPVTRELTITYAGVTFGGSTARQIDNYTIHEEEFERGYFEFEFVTTATSDAAFATEIIAVRDALRKPRQDLVVTQNGQTLLSRKHSDNTGLDTEPVITKDGDPADTGRSRHFRARISYGLPADNTSTNFRRTATINVEYEPSRRRRVTISGVYTANSSDGTTGSFAQYLAQISTYATSVLTAIDSSATWEKVGEPSVAYSDTDKVTNFTVVYREILHNQALGTVDDQDIIDPVLVISRHRIAPGDSAGSPLGITNTSIGLTSPGAGGNTVAEISQTSGGGDAQVLPLRPTVLTVTYQCAIDKTRTKDLTGKWQNTIRPFLIQEARTVAAIGVVLIDEKPDFDEYENRISATLTFHAYSGTILSQRVTVTDTTSPGRVLRPVWDGDPFSYYEFPGPAVRMKTVEETREEITAETDANAFVEKLVRSGAGVSGIANSANWVVVSRRPMAAILKRGLSGASEVNVAEVKVETVIQFRKAKRASVANAGGIMGAGISG